MTTYAIVHKPNINEQTVFPDGTRVYFDTPTGCIEAYVNSKGELLISAEQGQIVVLPLGANKISVECRS